MSEFKGTKGNWELLTQHSSDDLIGIKIVSVETVEDIIDFGLGGYIDEVQEANAKLIACAPEMLNFINEMAERYQKSEWIYKQAKEIIKKATT